MIQKYRNSPGPFLLPNGQFASHHKVLFFLPLKYFLNMLTSPLLSTLTLVCFTASFPDYDTFMLKHFQVILLLLGSEMLYHKP